MPAVKKLHWTQRPENRRRVMKQIRRAIAAKQVPVKKRRHRKKERITVDDTKHDAIEMPEPTNFIRKLQSLKLDASKRLKEIGDTITALNAERDEILEVFPSLKEQPTSH